MDNIHIAAIFLRIADALEIQDANVFRVRAYRNAAQNITALSRQLKEIYAKDPSELDALAGIGKDLREKIIEMIKTGKLGYHDELMKKFPDGFLDMLDLSGLGPKKLKKLRDALGVKNVDDLEKACKKGKLESIEGMGARTQEKLLEAIKHFKKRAGRMLLPEADHYADEMISYLLESKSFKKAVKAGSLRRGKETIGDIDILAVCGDDKKAMERFVNYPEAETVIAHGATKSSIMLKDGPQIDLRIVDASCFGAALSYFTGSKQHNVEVRKIAKKMGYKVNEYGVFSVRTGKNAKPLAGKTEEDLYHKLKMEWIPPELREAQGEIKAAQDGTLPRNLIKIADIRGDLHTHTTASDGRDTLEDMVRAAKDRGYEYIAVTDHSQYVKIAGGMDEKRLLQHVKKIRKFSQKIKGIRILAGVEVDILDKGELDLADYALKELDIVIAAVHSFFTLDRDKQTARILRAMDNKYVNGLAHPSGRLITKRNEINVDFDKIFKKAAENNIFLEVNTHGDRIDLNDARCRRAQEFGARFAINTDAHAAAQFDLVKYGVVTARRGWVKKKNVINTYPVGKLVKALKR